MSPRVGALASSQQERRRAPSANRASLPLACCRIALSGARPLASIRERCCGELVRRADGAVVRKQRTSRRQVSSMKIPSEPASESAGEYAAEELPVTRARQGSRSRDFEPHPS